ncbi:MAG TPA: FIST N-terminal domain-containing protein, partial [Caldimonas sp.]|nr:FIST N-terminal domain-containing protein [Caldimonas sp.]
MALQYRTLTFSRANGWSERLPATLDSAQTLVLAFAAPEVASAPAPLAELAAAFRNSVIVGCSTSGEIAGAQVHDASISVAVARFEHTQVRRAFTRIDGAVDSHGAGARLAEQLRDACDEPLRAVFVLSDGLCVNGTPLVAGLTAGLPC